jgi:thymidylate synthase ThyX
MEDPFIPIHWGKNQKGMQADEEIDDKLRFWAENEWLKARNNAVESAQKLLDLGIHKQIVNRIMEPFMWITVIMTATDHGNFYNLRDHKDAEPHIHHLARTMVEAHQASAPQELKKNEWHIPLCNYEGDDKLTTFQKLQVATGRCARVSYLTHDGKRDIQADIDLCKRLGASGHWSPFEHCAKAMGNDNYYGNFQGFRQYRKYFKNENRKEYDQR